MADIVLSTAVLDGLAHCTDPLADEIIATLVSGYERKDGVSDLAWRQSTFPELVRAVATPAKGSSIEAFLNGGEDLDKVVDRKLIQHAQLFFQENGVAVITALFHAALPEAYLGTRGVQVLDLTGGFVSNWTRRIHETGSFLVNILSPDPALVRSEQTSLSSGKSGAIIVRRVRLIHAMVRWLLSAEFERRDSHVMVSEFLKVTVWERRMVEVGEEVEAPAPGATKPVISGQPLNQEDLLATLGTFTTVTFAALEKMAISFDAKDREAFQHLWNVVGWHLGIGNRDALQGHEPPVEPRRRRTWPDNLILPLTAAEMDTLYAGFRRRLMGPTDQGRRLAKSLVQELAYPLPNMLQGAPAFFIRYLIGDGRADQLEIEAGGYAELLIRRTGLLGRIAESTRDHRLGGLTMGALSQAVTRYALKAFVAQSRSSDRGFAISPPIARRWGIQTGPEARVAPIETRRPV